MALSANGIVWGVTHILATPFAGAWADRHDRKKTMVVCDALNGLFSLSLVALMIAGIAPALAAAGYYGPFHGHR